MPRLRAPAGGVRSMPIVKVFTMTVVVLAFLALVTKGVLMAYIQTLFFISIVPFLVFIGSWLAKFYWRTEHELGWLVFAMLLFYMSDSMGWGKSLTTWMFGKAQLVPLEVVGGAVTGDVSAVLVVLAVLVLLYFAEPEAKHKLSDLIG